MELKEFISETIKQVADGLKEGSEYVITNNGGSGVLDDNYTKISFDIAVTTNEEDKTGIGGKIAVAQIFSAGADNENSNSITNSSRVKFTINLDVKTKNI